MDLTLAVSLTTPNEYPWNCQWPVARWLPRGGVRWGKPHEISNFNCWGFPQPAQLPHLVTKRGNRVGARGDWCIRAYVAKSVLTRITRYWMHYFQLFSATSTVKMPVFMKNYKFCWQNCKKNDVYVAKICNGKIRCFCRENLQTRALR